MSCLGIDLGVHATEYVMGQLRPALFPSGFAWSSLETTLKNWVETRKITKGLATWQFLGLILSMVTVGAYGGPRP